MHGPGKNSTPRRRRRRGPSPEKGGIAGTACNLRRGEAYSNSSAVRSRHCLRLSRRSTDDDDDDNNGALVVSCYHRCVVLFTLRCVGRTQLYFPSFLFARVFLFEKLYSCFQNAALSGADGFLGKGTCLALCTVNLAAREGCPLHVWPDRSPVRSI